MVSRKTFYITLILFLGLFASGQSQNFDLNSILKSGQDLMLKGNIYNNLDRLWLFDSDYFALNIENFENLIDPIDETHLIAEKDGFFSVYVRNGNLKNGLSNPTIYKNQTAILKIINKDGLNRLTIFLFKPIYIGFSNEKRWVLLKTNRLILKYEFEQSKDFNGLILSIDKKNKN